MRTIGGVFLQLEKTGEDNIARVALHQSITHFCLLMVDGYAWAIDKQIVMNNNRRTNQIDMMFVKMRLEMNVTQRERGKENESWTFLECFVRVWERGKKRRENSESFFFPSLSSHEPIRTGHQRHGGLSRKCQPNDSVLRRRTTILPLSCLAPYDEKRFVFVTLLIWSRTTIDSSRKNNCSAPEREISKSMGKRLRKEPALVRH